MVWLILLKPPTRRLKFHYQFFFHTNVKLNFICIINIQQCKSNRNYFLGSSTSFIRQSNLAVRGMRNG